MANKQIPRLAVVFDTSVLFTQVASDLVRRDIQRIVADNSNHTDLKTIWYLPEIVVEERRYQMLNKAKELIPNMQKLEKLIGHNFGVGEDTLALHVGKVINDNIAEYNLQIAHLDTTAVDWPNLINRSINREPPFEPSEREKGFRDSLIAHSFLQLQQGLPTTPSICRLAFVSEDQRLREYVSELTAEAKNVRILKGIDELESLINTLVSTVPEEFAAELAQKATTFFFEKENDKSLYFKEKIGEMIKEQYAAELNDTILPGHHRNGGTWWISPPIFIRKERQRIYWMSIIEPEFEIIHYEAGEAPQIALTGIGSNWMGELSGKGTSEFDLSKSIPAQGTVGHGFLSSLLPPPPPKKVVDIKGRARFEVHWSANLSQARNLTSAKVEKVHYAGINKAEGYS